MFKGLRILGVKTYFYFTASGSPFSRIGGVSPRHSPTPTSGDMSGAVDVTAYNDGGTTYFYNAAADEMVSKQQAVHLSVFFLDLLSAKDTADL